MNYWIEGTTLQFLLTVQDVYSDPTVFIDPDGLLYSGTTVTDLGTLEIDVTGQPSVVPTLVRVATGQYIVSFAGLSPLAGDSLVTVVVNGSLYGEAWSPYVVPFFVQRAIADVNVVSIANDAITADAIEAGALDGKGNWNIGKTGYELATSEHTAIGVAVWANETRTLSAFGFDVTVSALTTGAITADSIAASALNGKGNWNIGKTGYALTSSERTSIGTAVWANATRTLTSFVFGVNVINVDEDAISATSIAPGALDGKGDWNVGKTGYELTAGEHTAIGAAVWANATRTLSSFGFGVSVAEIADEAITGDAIADGALDGKGNWNVGKSGYELLTSEHAAIITGVWANATRTLSAFGFDVNVGSMNPDVLTADAIADGALDGKGDWGTVDGTVDANVVTVDGTPVVARDMEITVLGSRPVGNTLEITRGDSYLVETSTQIILTRSDYPDLTELTNTSAKLSIKDTGKIPLAGNRLVVDHVASTSIDPDTKTIVFELTSAQTLLDPSRTYMFDVELDFGSGKVVTVHRGPCVVFSNLENNS